jgi:hypothetical protein
MKPIRIMIASCMFALIAVSPAILVHKAVANSLGVRRSTALLSHVKSGSKHAAYPYTFMCKHCGAKMTITCAADLKKACGVCACGENASKCVGTKK